MDSISRETYLQLDTNSKLNVLFDLVENQRIIIENLSKQLSEQQGVWIQCLEKINSREHINLKWASMMGFVGGLVGYIGHFLAGIIFKK